MPWSGRDAPKVPPLVKRKNAKPGHGECDERAGGDSIDMPHGQLRPPLDSRVGRGLESADTPRHRRQAVHPTGVGRNDG